jgi:hypothetical protein
MILDSVTASVSERPSPGRGSNDSFVRHTDYGVSATIDHNCCKVLSSLRRGNFRFWPIVATGTWLKSTRCC